MRLVWIAGALVCARVARGQQCFGETTTATLIQTGTAGAQTTTSVFSSSSSVNCGAGSTCGNNRMATSVSARPRDASSDASQVLVVIPELVRVAGRCRRPGHPHELVHGLGLADVRARVADVLLLVASGDGRARRQHDDLVHVDGELRAVVGVRQHRNQRVVLHPHYRPGRSVESAYLIYDDDRARDVYSTIACRPHATFAVCSPAIQRMVRDRCRWPG